MREALGTLIVTVTVGAGAAKDQKVILFVCLFKKKVTEVYCVHMCTHTKK